MELSEARNAAKQMVNFFQAFKKIEEVLEYIVISEQRVRELEEMAVKLTLHNQKLTDQEFEATEKLDAALNSASTAQMQCDEHKAMLAESMKQEQIDFDAFVVEMKEKRAKIAEYNGKVIDQAKAERIRIASDIEDLENRKVAAEEALSKIRESI